MKKLTSLILTALTLIIGVQVCLAAPTKPQPNGVPTGRIIKQIAQNLKKYGLSTLPSAAGLVEQSTRKNAGKQDISGTPPTLTQISKGDSKNIFWRPGVIDAIGNGNPTPDQCEEFFGSGTDGESGGFGACQMASDVGQAFDSILEADLSRCYMQNVPTQENLDAGGIVIDHGKLPNDDITQIFSVGKKPRLIKVNVNGIQNIQDSNTFVRVSSAAENKSAGLLYNAESYSCNDGEVSAHGFDIIQVDDQGRYSFQGGNIDDSPNGYRFLLNVSGYLERSGEKNGWDEDSSRMALVQFISDRESFKTQFEITAQDLIILKAKYSYDNEIDNDYAITHFNGRSIKEATFLEGAFKITSDTSGFDFDFSGATEYRSPFYAFAPNNSLLPDVASYDIANDPFYAQLPNFDFDTSQYLCNAKPDIELTMKKNKVLENAIKPCSRNQLQEMDFCRDDADVRKAELNYPNVCPQ